MRSTSKSILLAVSLAGLVLGSWMLGGGSPEPAQERELEPPPGVRVDQGPGAQERYAALLRAREAAAPRADPVAVLPVDEQPALERPLEAPAPVEVLRCLLQDEEGHPVAGVRATLTVLPGSLANRAHRPALATADWTPQSPAGAQVLAATSTAHGELRFERVPWSRRIRIDVPAQFDFAHAAWFGATAHPRLLTLTLSPGGEPLLLRVDGFPVDPEGASVIVRAASFGAAWSVPISRMEAHCAVLLDAEGRAALPRTPAGSLVADVVLPRVGMWRGLPVEREGGGTAHVDLGRPSTATVCGVLRGPDGTGVGGAMLALAVRSYLQTSPPRSWLRWGRTDAEGRFELRGVPVGVVDELYVTAPGHVAPRLVLEGAPLRPEETLDVALQLIPGCSVAGIVTDASGAPRRGVQVSPSSSSTFMMQWDPAATWTDGRGRYRIDGLPPGEVRLDVRETDGPARVEVRVEVGPEELARAPRAVLEPSPAGGRIEVEVRDVAGQPVSGAWIGYRTKRVDLSGTVHTGPTGPDGTFVIEDVGAGAERIEVWAHKQGGASVAYAVSPADVVGGTAHVRVLLPPVGRVTGRVLRGDEPAPGVRVVALDTQRHAQPDDEGRYRLQGVPAGWQVLQARSPDGRDLGAPLEVLVRADETVEVDLLVPPIRHEVFLRGRLLDGEGRPLAGVDLAASRSTRFAPAVAARTGPAGRFEIPVAGRGDHPLYSGERLVRPALSPGTEPADVVFDPRALPVVQGTILDAQGDQVTAAQVHVTVDGSGRKPEAHVAGGFFRLLLSGRRAGRLQVHVYAGHRDVSGRAVRGTFEPVAFRPDETVSVGARAPGSEDARMSGASLAGFVVDVGGRPLEGAMISAGRDGAERAARSKEDGTFLLQDLPAGRLLLQVVGPPGFDRSQEPVPVESEAGPVAITIPRTPPDRLFTARGRILDLDDQPIPNAPLVLWGRALGVARQGRSDADGRFAFPLVPRDEVTVQLDPGWDGRGYHDAGRMRHFDDVEVSPEANDVVLRLPLRRRDPQQEHDVDVSLHDAVGDVLPGTSPRVRLAGTGSRDGHDRATDPFAFSRGATRTQILGVAAGRYQVEVTLPGIDSAYLPVESWEVEVPCPPIEIHLERAAELHGRVVGDDVEGYQVRVRSPGGRAWMQRVSGTGAFAFYVDPEAVFSVTVHHPERAKYGRVADVTAADAPLRVALEHEGLGIAGRIAGLEQVKDYRLQIVGPLFTRDLRLDDALHFEILGVPPGEYRLEFSSYDYDENDGPMGATQRVRAGDTEIVLTAAR